METGQELKLEALQKTRFFIEATLAESFPLLLIVFGFIQIEQYKGDLISMMLPIIIIIILAVLSYAIVNVLMTRSDIVRFDEITNETKNVVNTLIFIGITKTLAIPVISLVAIFIMLGN